MVYSNGSGSSGGSGGNNSGSSSSGNGSSDSGSGDCGGSCSGSRGSGGSSLVVAVSVFSMTEMKGRSQYISVLKVRVCLVCIDT